MNEKLKKLKGKEDRFLTMRELAELLGVSYVTVAVRYKRLIPYYEIGGRPLFKLSEVIAFLEENRVEPKRRA